MDVDEVARIQDEVIRLRLDGWEFVKSYQPAELAECYNGTGPEFLPEQIRAKLDDIASPFLPAVMVHDVDFTWSDGTVTAFRAANIRLLRNCITCALDAQPWNSWRRYVLLLEAVTIYKACKQFGWIAWRLACQNNQQRSNHE